MILWRVFYTMLLAGMAAVGGAYGTIAVAQSAWVGPGMLSPESFAWAVALGQLTPGPLAILVVALGWQIKGLSGAVVALLGISLPTWGISCLAARGLARYRRALVPYTRGLPWLVTGMALSAGIKMALPLHPGWVEVGGIAVFAALAATGKIEAYWLIAAGAVAGAMTLML